VVQTDKVVNTRIKICDNSAARAMGRKFEPLRGSPAQETCPRKRLSGMQHIASRLLYAQI
jgi:hypothetical protein